MTEQSRDPVTPEPNKPRRRLYSSLPLSPRSRQIRVLDLDAASGRSSSSVVSGTLRIVDLDDDPDFAAVSYVWGEYASPPSAIMCNGMSLPVTVNCIAILRRLARLYGKKTVWIDSICIDQHNEAEKDDQIALMADVYSGARNVYVWLGEGSMNTDRAMDFLARGSLPIIRSNSVWFSSFLFGVYLYRRRFLWGLWPSFALLDAGLTHVFPRPWITRIWTFQEAVLARDLHIICGNKVVPWVALVRALDGLDFDGCFKFFHVPPEVQAWRRVVEVWKHHHKTDPAPEFNRIVLERGLALYFLLRAITRSLLLGTFALYIWITVIFLILTRETELETLGVCWAVMSIVIMIGLAACNTFHQTPHAAFRLFASIGRLSLSDSILTELRLRQSQFPRDKYFGVQSLLDPHIDRRTVDYVKTPLPVVYETLFEKAAEYTSSLEILLLTPRPSSRPSFLLQSPSWVTDWANVPTWWAQPLRDFLSPNDGVLSIRYPWSFMTAKIPWPPGHRSRSRLWEFIHRPTSVTQLRVVGGIVARVTWSSGVIQWSHLADEQCQARYFCELFSHLDPDLLLVRYLANLGNLTDKQLVRWMVKQLEEARGTGSVLQDFVKWVEDEREKSTMTNGRLAHGLSRLFSYPQKERLALVRASPLPYYPPNWSRYFKKKDLWRMRFNQGLAPNDAIEGDVFAVIRGLDFPMLLRPRQDTPNAFRVIGPAFMPVLMGRVIALGQEQPQGNLILM